jgi:lipid II:glycine glycyltransferase (peptidoglycan interpeptide bridge formation enzyme)
LDGLQAFLLEHDCQVGRALFTPYTFILDLTKSEEDLLAQMKPKTRYNLRLAQKHGVQIVEDSTEAGFQDYLKLLKETTKRQGFYAHTENYQRKMWEKLQPTGIAHLIKAVWQGQVLVTWIVFNYKGRLFYPYGASSREHKELMASNLMMWEVIKLGKRWGCKLLDMWGALPPNPNPKDPWFGFHNFKEGYGGVHARFVGTFDLVIDPNLYKLYRIADRWRWRLLRLKAKLPF